MKRFAPILAGERLAAELLDLKLSDFSRLVGEGHLPRGREIAPGVVRWSVDDLRGIANGTVAEGMGDVKW
ncbi:MAG: hypothetical protein AAFQ47_11440 [Pseudomonadota bacterium]